RQYVVAFEIECRVFPLQHAPCEVAHLFRFGGFHPIFVDVRTCGCSTCGLRGRWSRRERTDNEQRHESKELPVSNDLPFHGRWPPLAKRLRVGYGFFTSMRAWFA